MGSFPFFLQERAEQLITGFGGERAKWSAMSDKLQESWTRGKLKWRETVLGG